MRLATLGNRLEALAPAVQDGADESALREYGSKRRVGHELIHPRPEGRGMINGLGFPTRA